VKTFNPRRRELLQTAAGLFAASAWLRGVSAAPSLSPLMATLSDYMSGAAGRTLPEAATEKAKQCILDTLAAMISGSTLPPGRFAIQFARSYGGDRICTVAGSNIVCGPIEAALANGLLAHSDETDDTHPPSQSHPGCAVVPAALAMGEKFGIGGAHFLRAVAPGYDIGPRFTITLGKLEYMVDTHRSTHALSSEFGSAAAAGCAARLNPQQMHGSFPGQRSKPRAWLPGSATPITSRRLSISPEWERRQEWRRRSWCRLGPPVSTMFCPAPIISSKRLGRRTTSAFSSKNWESATR
jgi:hypothetical protein